MASHWLLVLLCACCCGVVLGAPLSTRMVDLTHPFDSRSHKYPIFKNFSMEVVMNGTFMDTDIWIQSEEFASTTHAGTHMDAPAHFVAGGATIDQLPISQFIGPAAVIDITERAQEDKDTLVTQADLEAWEEAAGRSLEGHIVLMRSGWDRYYYNYTAYVGTPERDVHQMHFPGFSREASLFMVERGVKGTGVDTLSLDRGMSTEFWSHRILLRNGIFILENVANLADIPVVGATLYVLPMKIAGGSGAPTRIIATYPHVVFKR